MNFSTAMNSYFKDNFGYFDENLTDTQWQLFYPNNPSLAEDLQRLFSHLSGPNQQHEYQKCGIREEFQRNGTESDCPFVPYSGFTPLIPRAVVGKRNPQKPMRKKHECVFCKNNGEQKVHYQGHILKDKNGKVTCPVLRRYTCPICGANGDSAHTVKYCPKNSNKDSLLSLTPMMKLVKSSSTDRGGGGGFSSSVWPC